MTAWYNEIDDKAAATLRELIKAGHIAPGVVDTRSIEDIEPDELIRHTQCHFFAGFGVWSYALRLAGWPDSRPVWTGSCPCQPFSAAGKGAGFSDERHLWPAWFHSIQQCRPAVVFGEQVASKDAGPWLDLVQDDLEAMGYAFGAVPFPSAGVGAPHIRDRAYWVANTDRHDGAGWAGEADEKRSLESDRLRAADFVVDASSARLAQCLGLGRVPGEAYRADQRQAIERAGLHAGALAHDDDAGRGAEPSLRLRGSGIHDADGRRPGSGFWADADWIACRDGKWRPVEPGTFPLAHGAPARVGRLRGYGNAINAEAARAFIEAYLESEIA